LRDDREWANLLFGELACGTVGLDVVGMYEDTVSDMERRGHLVVAVGIGSHGVLGILHTVVKEAVQFVKVNSEVASSEVCDLSIWVNSDQQIISTVCEEWGDACCSMRSIVIGKLS
jgi:hypothetical protein